MKYVVDLSELRLSDIDKVGGKSASLGEIKANVQKNKALDVALTWCNQYRTRLLKQ